MNTQRKHNELTKQRDYTLMADSGMEQTPSFSFRHTFFSISYILQLQTDCQEQNAPVHTLLCTFGQAPVFHDLVWVP